MIFNTIPAATISKVDNDMIAINGLQNTNAQVLKSGNEWKLITLPYLIPIYDK